MAGSQHARWIPSGPDTDDPERLAIREAMAFGKALYDRRTDLGLSTAELAERLSVTEDEVACMEEGGTQPTLDLLRRLAGALEADVRLTSGHELGSLLFEAHVA
ncbi:helix-turn-helix transcriptional regulator [Streptomyces sp. NPDC052225]|uniref:helix-turn-helix domain-containing protein n=1 Tax=Streptomyces sp. NPDC052225 TaxID=3154949 RepID=UPI00341D61C6